MKLRIFSDEAGKMNRSVVDVGGGTSDFTVVRLGPSLMHKPNRADDVLATTGVHIGGTDFDRNLSMRAVMPALGLGTELIDKQLPMPR